MNQTYLIAYRIDDNKDILGKEFYFNFPKAIDQFQSSNNFHPYNNFISPKINISKSEYTPLLNDSFFFENWFINQDYSFRTLASEDFDMHMDFLHLNNNHEGSINKSSIVTMQTFYSHMAHKQRKP